MALPHHASEHFRYELHQTYTHGLTQILWNQLNIVLSICVAHIRWAVRSCFAVTKLITFGNRAHYSDLFTAICVQYDRICGLVVRIPDPEVRVRIPGLPDFLRSSGSGTGSTQSREHNWGVIERKSSGSGLENREYGRREPSRWRRVILYPQKQA
jgi:hypothetical protein